MTSAGAFWRHWKQKNHRPTKAYLAFVLFASVVAYFTREDVAEILALIALYVSLIAYSHITPKALPGTIASIQLQKISEKHYQCQFGEVRLEAPMGWYAYPKGQPEIGPFQTMAGAVGALLSIHDNDSGL